MNMNFKQPLIGFAPDLASWIMSILRDAVQCAAKMLLLLWNRVSKKTRIRPPGNGSIHLMEDLAEGSWFRAYKIQLAWELKTTDHKAQRKFGDGPKIRWPPVLTFTGNFNSAIKLTFRWIGALINKIAAFYVMIIHKPLLRRRYIFKKSLFGVLYGPRESLIHISSKTKLTIMLQSMARSIEPRLMALLCLNLR